MNPPDEPTADEPVDSALVRANKLSQFRAGLRRVRALRRLSTRQLAERLRERCGYELSSPAISRIENEQRGVTLTDALALAEALDVPLGALLRTDEEWSHLLATGESEVGA